MTRRSGIITAAQMSSAPVLGPVANRTFIPTTLWGGGVYTQFNSRSWHRATDNINALYLILPNWEVDGSGVEGPTTNGDETQTASIEYPVDSFTQVTFGGSSSVVIADGAQTTSDIVNVSIPSGASFFVRTYQTGALGAVMSGNIGDPTRGDCYEKAASGLADKTMGGTISAVASYDYMYMPIAILGLTRLPTVACIGDSRVYGYYDLPTNGDRGDLGGVSTSHLNLGVNGDRAQWFVASHAKRLALANYCSNIILEYGINDLANGRSDAQIQADLSTIAGYFPGKRVFLSTMEPSSTSTDNWATTVNQTSAAYNAARVTNNNWRRTVPPGFSSCFEIADVVESARDSGLWKAPGYSPDGVHETQASFDTVRASGAIPAGAFI